MPTVADQMVETLAAAGAGRIYGIVGDSLNGFTDALRRSANGDEDRSSVSGASRHQPVTAQLALIRAVISDIRSNPVPHHHLLE